MVDGDGFTEAQEEGPEMSYWGMPLTWDGSMEPRHIFFVRNAVDLPTDTWTGMRDDGGLEWVVAPLTSRRKAISDGNQKRTG